MNERVFCFSHGADNRSTEMQFNSVFVDIKASHFHPSGKKDNV